MADLPEKLSDTVEVKTLLTRIHCPNKSCKAFLEHDKVTRNLNGIHGGDQEYRHRCPECGAGYWLRTVYPKVSYVPVVPQGEIESEG